MEASIYRDMELLEDAFEALHAKAESLRTQMRGRAAGLRAAVKARTPTAVASTSPERSVLGGFDDASSLAPDDSASNVNFARRSRREAERRGDAGTAAERRRRR